MRKHGPNPKVFMILALGTFVLGGGAVFFEYSGMSDQASKVQKMRADVKNSKDVEKELATSTTDLSDTSAKLKHLEESVPDFAYIPTLLKDLETAGKANGIEVLGVRPMPKPAVARKDGDRPERKPYEELNIEVKGRGKYADVMKFVTALQTFPKIVACRTLNVSPKAGADGKSSNMLDVSIELRAYVFPDPVNAKPTGVKEDKTARLEVTRHEG